MAGRLHLDLPDGTVTLGPHEVFTVPKGVPHRPRGTVDTGDGNEGTTGVHPA